jgi:hypothetical protein
VDDVRCPKCQRLVPRGETVATKNRRALWCKPCYQRAVGDGVKGKRLSSDPLAKGRDYRSRNAILRGLGFATYRDYLASDLWRTVRAAVFKVKGRACYLCGKPATELHHNRYHANDLTGKRLKFINPICRGCHEGIEFQGGEKVTLKKAASTFRKRRRAKP